MATKKKPKALKSKKASKKQSTNPTSLEMTEGPPPNEQDVKRRLGNFEGAGEPPRKGGRKGIVGQTTKTFRTDNKTKRK